ncbi:sigma-54-dependent Fis family transcriptional regulator [Desulfoscipio gibsoniae]|uniref:PAS domain S-box n=1 Tax=Desulfoscipio gibsoniae DSM 7213 TaxID=767817 RepID=R4KL94_9FIRM|nr:sigma-54-dependent Fis family transcriptional regulator [Desulfoscipio gibsoniae]AGL03429.1 PAS domain S-box [Desulfoscipio gibsoniae DSM 7213]
MVVSSTRLNKKKKLEKYWEGFITSDKFDLSQLNSTIASSWQRCKEAEVNPLGGKCDRIFGRDRLEQLWEANRILLEVAAPVIESVYYTVQGSDFMVVLVNNEGIILKTMGDYQTLSSAERLNFRQGAVWTEDSVGTNAIGTSLTSGIPIQITGPEHFCSHHHVWTCSAAPIRDPEGHVLGCLDMSGPYDKMHPHTLGMIVAAAQAIEYQLRRELSKSELELALKKLTTAVDTVNDGIIYINKDGIITDANIPACNLLGLSHGKLKGMRFNHVLGGDIASGCLTAGASANGEDFIISAPPGRLVCSIKTITHNNGTIGGAVAVIRIQKNGAKGPVSYCTGGKMKVAGGPRTDTGSGNGLVRSSGGVSAGTTSRQANPFNGIIGCSRPICAAINLARRAAACSSTVLLLGESGSGKEVFATSIHMASDRRQGPFIPVNCASLPSGLIQSELFGYSGGSFTGAKRDGQQGKFELANGGTLFLDEIGDMPLDMQANLLRVLQEKAVMRVGGSKMIPVDVRVIAATNKDLFQEMQQGRFREDLFYRINVLCIEIPPLRDRGAGDLQLLTQHLLVSIAARLGRPVCKIDSAAMEMLAEYHWPGNVRELANVLEQMLIITDDDVTRVEHLPRYLQKSARDSKGLAGQVSCAPEESRSSNPVSTLEQIEKQAIREALQCFGGNISRTAQALGIGRNTLYGKLKKYDLND